VSRIARPSEGDVVHAPKPVSLSGSAQKPPSSDERVYAAIHAAVQEHRLEPGIKLKEVELTELFQVSRASVRTALHRLAHKGILQLAPNRGASVAKPSADECRQILECRLAIEGMVIEVLARAPDAAAVKALRAHVRAQERAFKTGDTVEGHRLAIAFHRLLAQHCGNRVLAQLLDDLLSRMPLIVLTHGAKRASGEATHADHIDLVEAIAGGDIERGRGILKLHLQALQDELDLGAPPSRKTLKQMLQR
jgi:DNA-binding GntR family transcriptional regulator